MQEGLPTFSCPAHIVFVRCEQNAITMQRGLFSIWEQPFLAFWVIESVVLAMFQLCALKLGPFAHIESARRMRYGPGEPAIRSRCAINPSFLFTRRSHRGKPYT